MTVYEVSPPRGEDNADGEPTSEWYGSLVEASKAFIVWKRIGDLKAKFGRQP